MLSNNFEESFKRAVADLVDECCSEEAALRMGYYDPREELEAGRGESEVKLRSEELGRVLENATRELKEPRSHSCEWSEDPDSGRVYCPVCGAEGLTRET